VKIGILLFIFLQIYGLILSTRVDDSRNTMSIGSLFGGALFSSLYIYFLIRFALSGGPNTRLEFFKLLKIMLQYEYK
jgi:hypothetical protein